MTRSTRLRSAPKETESPSTRRATASGRGVGGDEQRDSQVHGQGLSPARRPGCHRANRSTSRHNKRSTGGPGGESRSSPPPEPPMPQGSGSAPPPVGLGTKGGSMRRMLLALTLALTSTTLVALAPTAAHAVDCSAGGFVGSANSVRAGQGLPPLEWDSGLAGKASGWASYMAGQNAISHSNLSGRRLRRLVPPRRERRSWSRYRFHRPGAHQLAGPLRKSHRSGVPVHRCGRREHSRHVLRVGSVHGTSLPARPKHVRIGCWNPDFRRLFGWIVVRIWILRISFRRTRRGASAAAPSAAASGAADRGAGTTARPRRVVAGLPPPAITRETDPSEAVVERAPPELVVGAAHEHVEALRSP